MHHYRLPSGLFLQSDPIRFHGGDVNIYRYVGNNTVNFIDPSGLLATVTNTSGVTVTVGTAKELHDVIKAAPANSIKDINIAGHANQTTQGISDDRAASERVELGSSGRPQLTGPSLGDSPIDFGAILTGKMTSSGNITFDGCRAGSEKTSPENPTGNNLPKATSSVVPDITTKGSRTPTFGRTPSTNNTPIPGTTNTYRNGQKI